MNVQIKLHAVTSETKPLALSKPNAWDNHPFILIEWVCLLRYNTQCDSELQMLLPAQMWDNDWGKKYIYSTDTSRENNIKPTEIVIFKCRLEVEDIMCVKLSMNEAFC